MKKYSFLLLIAAALTACTIDPVDPLADDETEYSPILMERPIMESAIEVSEPKELQNPGKIYAYGKYIFISDLYNGIHIIDNSDSTKPVKLKFIQIPGSVDMAIKNNRLYADNATDLLTFDISDLQNVQLIDRLPDVYPDLLPPDATLLPQEYSKEKRPKNTIIIQWVKK